MALVTSTVAHANILSIDSSEALSMPGVKDFICGDDIPGAHYYRPTQDEPVFAEKEVTHTQK